MGRKMSKSKKSNSFLERIAEANEEAFGTKRLNYYDIYDYQTATEDDDEILENRSREVKQFS